MTDHQQRVHEASCGSTSGSRDFIGCPQLNQPRKDNKMAARLKVQLVSKSTNTYDHGESWRKCCGNPEWRGHLCQFHQGFVDGYEMGLDDERL